MAKYGKVEMYGKVYGKVWQSMAKLPLQLIAAIYFRFFEFSPITFAVRWLHGPASCEFIRKIAKLQTPMNSYGN